MTTPAPDDPYGLGPWAECVSCHRRYRPAHQSGRCYGCVHQTTESTVSATNVSTNNSVTESDTRLVTMETS